MWGSLIWCNFPCFFDSVTVQPVFYRVQFATGGYDERQEEGIGFDIAQSKDDGRTHIGIENVRQHLEMISGASLDIRSSPGKGTKAVVRIPKEDRDNEGTGS